MSATDRVRRKPGYGSLSQLSKFWSWGVKDRNKSAGGSGVLSRYNGGSLDTRSILENIDCPRTANLLALTSAIRSVASGNPLRSAPCGKNNLARFIGLEGNGVKLMVLLSKNALPENSLCTTS